MHNSNEYSVVPCLPEATYIYSCGYCTREQSHLRDWKGMPTPDPVESRLGDGLPEDMQGLAESMGRYEGMSATEHWLPPDWRGVLLPNTLPKTFSDGRGRLK